MVDWDDRCGILGEAVFFNWEARVEEVGDRRGSAGLLSLGGA